MALGLLENEDITMTTNECYSPFAREYFMESTNQISLIERTTLDREELLTKKPFEARLRGGNYKTFQDK